VTGRGHCAGFVTGRGHCSLIKYELELLEGECGERGLNKREEIYYHKEKRFIITISLYFLFLKN
jgi:hypothetical protein